MKLLSRETLHSLIGLLFVFSGALGLIYQIVWFKYLTLFLGNTTYAQTIVLATFMAGLAIGAAWWGRKVDQVRHPLRLYALLELGIGLYCLLYPKFHELLEDLFISTVISLRLPSDGALVLLLKLFISCCTLLIPTILMGGTLPVLVRFISRRLDESGKNVALLYFLNSFGAVLGSFLAGFFLIRILGLSMTVYVTAVVNLLLGALAFLLSRWHIPEGNLVEEKKESLRVFSRREMILAVTVAGISGLAAMIYEVTWVRLLIPVLGSAIYSFAIMLVAFITGITLGSYIVSTLVQRIKNLTAFLVWCQVGIVLSMLFMLPFYARIPYDFWRVASILIRNEGTYPLFLAIQFLFGFTLMIVPTIFLGMSLPIATRIASYAIDALGKSVGNIFAVNTLGTVIGSLLAGLVLIPLIGVKHTIEVGIGCNLAAAIFLIVFTPAFSRRQITIVLPVVFLAITLYAVFVPNWSRGAMLSGVFRNINTNTEPPASYSVFARQSALIRVRYYKEGTMATVGVVEGITSDGPQRVLIVNGKPDASSRGDLPTQVLLGQIPSLLHHNLQNALVIGLGSGVTVGSILTHPVKSVDCVEISPEVVEACSEFDEVNYHPLNDSRTKLFIEDAHAFLKITPRRYDIIVSEPSNPWIAGIGSLYTKEFFEECKRKMNDGGLMVQWFHAYEMNDNIFKMVVRSFQSSFNFVSMWQPLNGDIMLIGCDQEIRFDFERLRTAIAMPAVKKDLDRITIPDIATLLSLEMLSPESVARYVGAGEFNTEDHPRVEYGAPSAFFVNKGIHLSGFDDRMRCDSIALQLRILSAVRRLTDEELWNIGMLHTENLRGNTSFGYGVLTELRLRRPKDIRLLALLAEVAERLQLSDEAIGYRKTLLELQPDDPNVLERYAWTKYSHERIHTNILSPRETKEYERLLRKSIALVSDTVDRYRARLADIFFGTQRYALAMDQYARTIQIRAAYTHSSNIQDDVLFLQLARCLRYLHKDGRAAGFALEALKFNPQNEEAKDLFYDIWTKGILPQR